MDTTREAEIRAAHEALFPSTPPIPFAVVTLLAIATLLGSLAWSFLPTWAQDIEATAPLAALVATLLMKATKRRWWGVARVAVLLNLTFVPCLILVFGHVVNTPDGFGVLLLPVGIAAILCGGWTFLTLRDWAANNPDERRPPHAVLLALFMALVAFGYFQMVAELANEQLDRSQPQLFRPLVTRKYARHWRQTSFYVELGSFGSWTADGRWRVTRLDYDRLSIGQPACVAAHTGALKVRWVVVQSCA